MSTLTPTPGQTIGPFFGYALPFDRDSELVPAGSTGAIRLHGTVTDGAGAPVPDALLEIWQTGADGTVPTTPGSLRRDGWTFTGWGRASTDPEGNYSFTTVEPVAMEPDSAAFFAVTIFARGLLNRLFTRAYVPGDGIATDRLLASLPPERRDTLIAVRDEHGLRFDVRLQAGADGAAETVFLRYPGHRP
ncbi:protocatechuate 3,4-dioxygenase subunit alpha [Mycolicibacterium moriokaense]|nr:protocatechuate 3,4-dioxygenase subunit alpha [Mycolicibacterium moriokaense]